jgi:Zn-dependent peptidase ImmA (M78 family)
MASLDTNRGAKRARQARQALELPADAPLPCLLTVVEERARLPVIVAGGLPPHIAGACFRSGDGAVLWVNGTQPVVRQRFTLAHELAHAWCGHDGEGVVDTVETLSGRTTNAYEIQANAFAAEFLVPRACLEEVIEAEPTLEEVVIIAAHCGVSAIVVVYRLKQLDMASAERIGRLEDEVAQGLHERVAGRLAVARTADRLAAIGDALPYVSPALEGSHLGARLHRDAPVDRRTAGAIDRLLA